jgi:hypothetical protein
MLPTARDFKRADRKVLGAQMHFCKWGRAQPVKALNPSRGFVAERAVRFGSDRAHRIRRPSQSGNWYYY